MNHDLITMGIFPLLAASRTGVLQDPDKHGVRYVAANNGLWRAIDTAWLKALTPVALCSKTAVIPYGQLTRSVEFFCSMPPASLWREFAALAKASLPNEVAAAMLWNAEHDTWRLSARHSIEANPQFVKYQEVELQDGEHFVVDIHSHGKLPAFFSPTDSQDDFGSIKVSAVLGCVGHGETNIRMRLMLIDQHIDLKLVASGSWEIQEKQRNLFNET